MGTVGREALDRMLTLGRQQLRSVLAEYVNDCKAHCPHGGLGQALLLGVASLLAWRRLGGSCDEIGWVG